MKNETLGKLTILETQCGADRESFRESLKGEYADIEFGLLCDRVAYVCAEFRKLNYLLETNPVLKGHMDALKALELAKKNAKP